MDAGAKQCGSEPASPAQDRAARVTRSCSRRWPPVSTVPNAAAEPGVHAMNIITTRHARNLNRRLRTRIASPLERPPVGPQAASGRPLSDRVAPGTEATSSRRGDHHAASPAQGPGHGGARGLRPEHLTRHHRPCPARPPAHPAAAPRRAGRTAPPSRRTTGSSPAQPAAAAPSAATRAHRDAPARS